LKIAINTDESEIFNFITAAVNFRNDVFNVERAELRIILMQMTVFASVLSTLANLTLICALIICEAGWRSGLLVV
jgi:hypothetical protein